MLKIMCDVAALASGSANTMVIRTDGSVWSWGRSDSGQLGDGTTIDIDLPTKIMYITCKNYE